MTQKTHSQWFAFDGLNANYLLDQYEVYLQDPQAVEESLIPIFKVWDGLEGVADGESVSSSQGLSGEDKLEWAQLTVAATKYVNTVRSQGHLKADIFPLGRPKAFDKLVTEDITFDLDQVKDIPADLFNPHAEGSAADYIQGLADLYMADIGFDLAHLPSQEREWFYQQIEDGFIQKEIAKLDREQVIEEIFRAEVLEQYLQRHYMDQKRFSGEGLETLIPLMNRLIALAAEEGIHQVYISMAHRARLNALVHVLDQSYEWLLSKFEGTQYDGGEPSDYDRYNSTGDVKYHLGAKTQRQYGDHTIDITLANNPSHLEFVNSVIQGMARAAQDDRTQPGYSQQDFNQALPILVHGDAAVIGQGVNYETFNLSNLKAYSTGGSIHIIANNVIGFTTYNEEQLSTPYASDPSKGFGFPVLLLNADKPETSVAAIKLALMYRQTFHKDIVINLIGYRRLGHNELDEPRMTNPMMYKKVDALGTITQVYQDYLLEKGLVKDEVYFQGLKDKITEELDQARDEVKSAGKGQEDDRTLGQMIQEKLVNLPEVDTSLNKETLSRLNDQLITWDDGFNIIKNLDRSLSRRRNVFKDGLLVDWSLAEALALASILEDGNPIRITGEDSERGTFSHRSMVMKDTESGENYTPIHHISEGKASFDIYNSSLSEMAVLGFEYGYSMTAHEALVFWEAQFGDFANGAQVIIDQFISGGRKKWGELSGLVMLLPHGYEGAGPEHSSGRIERFLQLSAEKSWTVANLSTAAQLFHLLRRQAAALGSENIRPLVLFTPKSLLRSEDAASPIEVFTQGAFQPVLPESREDLDPAKVTRLVLASGRLNIDIHKALAQADAKDRIAHVRVEELYPFPGQELKEVLDTYPNLEEVVWVQEEPKNMGAYSYMHLQLLDILPAGIKVDYIGRPAMSAPSEGLPAVHKREQARILRQALDLDTPAK